MSEPFLIEVKPAGVRFKASRGETVMEAANRAGIYWPTICGAEARCLACMFPVDSSAELAPADADERDALAAAGRQVENFRLACRARVAGDLELFQRRVREAVPGDRLPAIQDI